MNNYLLVLERSEGNLAYIPESGKYCLEGVFTEFGIKNKNNRIYDKSEMMPHIKELQEKIKGNKLLGELDHPKSFDISLKNASHIIEEIRYDEASNKVYGKIRLLNTDAGKQAMALVDAGVPLHISSRAAGVVGSDNHVQIKKVFTYDLVADPGFANAELKRVNESLGFGDDKLVQIYELPDAVIEENENQNNTEINMDNAKKFITLEDFNDYTKLVKNEIEKVNQTLSSLSESKTEGLNEGIVKYSEATAERVNQLTSYVKHLAETLDNVISHNDYIIEGLENVKNYAQYAVENVDNSINYTEKIAESADHLIEYVKLVAEKADQGIEYTKLVAEKADQGIEFAKYIAEESNNRWSYQSYINENVDNIISHNDYIIEGLSSAVSYADYLKENTQNMINYVDFIVAEMNESSTEKTTAPVVNENKTTEETVDTYKASISAKLDAILENAKTEPKKKDLPFMSFLSESKRAEFNSLEESEKERVTRIFENSKYYGTADVEAIYENAFHKEPVTLNWLTDMPTQYIESWNGLNESQKNSIKAQASIRSLDTAYKIENFWSTRDLRASKVEVINESELRATLNLTETTGYQTPSAYMEAVQEGLKRRFGK